MANRHIPPVSSLALGVLWTSISKSAHYPINYSDYARSNPPAVGSLLGYVKGTFSLGPSLKNLRIGGAITKDSGPPAPMMKE